MSDPEIPEILQRLAHEAGGVIDHVSPMLPDGSGYATMSLPLPADHWSTKHTVDYEPPPMPFRMGRDDPRREAWAMNIRAAGRYAYRAATMEGRDTDLDPDALLQNLEVAMLGYWTADGLSEDAWANPTPLPPIFTERTKEIP